MLKRLIGVSAALSVLILATTASAGPPRQLQRVQSVARFAPDHVSRARVQKPHVYVERTTQVRRTRPMINPGVDRIRPGVDGTSRPARVVVRPTSTSSAPAPRTVVDRRSVMRDYNTTSCRDTGTCGSSSRAAERAVAQQNQGPIEKMRERARSKRIFDMIMAKAHKAAGHTGK